MAGRARGDVPWPVPDGTVTRRDVGSVVTACAFGGPDPDRPFITTSREHLDPGTGPEAGAPFTRASDVRGLPVREFAGRTGDP